MAAFYLKKAPAPCFLSSVSSVPCKAYLCSIIFRQLCSNGASLSVLKSEVQRTRWNVERRGPTLAVLGGCGGWGQAFKREWKEQKTVNCSHHQSSKCVSTGLSCFVVAPFPLHLTRSGPVRSPDPLLCHTLRGRALSSRLYIPLLPRRPSALNVGKRALGVAALMQRRLSCAGAPIDDVAFGWGGRHRRCTRPAFIRPSLIVPWFVVFFFLHIRLSVINTYKYKRLFSLP